MGRKRIKGETEMGGLFLREECHLKIVHGMIEFLKSPFCNSLVITDSCKLPEWTLKSLGEKLLGNKTFT